VKAVFSSQFKVDLLNAEKRYGEISPKLASALRERITLDDLTILLSKRTIFSAESSMNEVTKRLT
jgi:hypothetical protein